jgi:hypothetical protein
MAKTSSRDKGLELESSIARLLPHIETRRARWEKTAKMIPRMALLLAIALCSLVQPAPAQTFPDHCLRLVVPFPPGGASDVLGRILAKRMSEILGQAIVVENHGRPHVEADALTARLNSAKSTRGLNNVVRTAMRMER